MMTLLNHNELMKYYYTEKKKERLKLKLRSMFHKWRAMLKMEKLP
jgi:hypothetical protein